MKFGIKLTNIEIADIKIGGVEINTEFSINEMIAMRKETEIVLKKMPEYISDLAEGMRTVDKIQSEFDAKAEEDMRQRLINTALNNEVSRAIRDFVYRTDNEDENSVG